MRTHRVKAQKPAEAGIAAPGEKELRRRRRRHEHGTCNKAVLGYYCFGRPEDNWEECQ